MKKVLCSLLAGLMVTFCLSGCAAQTQQKEEVPKAVQESPAEEADAAEEPAGNGGTIAWLLLGANDWTVEYADTAKELCAAAGYEYVDYNCEGDVQKQLDHIQTCISSKVKAIVIQPAENTAVAPAMKKAADEGIIVINHFEMEEALGCNDYPGIYYAVLGQYECGKTVGEYFAQTLPEGSKVGLIGGTAGADNNNQRKQGFKDAVEGKLEVVSEVDANWDRAKAQSAAEDMMTQFSDLAGIYAVDDGMATGVAAAVSAADKQEQIFIGGTGGDVNGITLIKDGEINVTVTSGCAWFAESAMEIVEELDAGGTVDEMIKFMPELITADNVADFE